MKKKSKGKFLMLSTDAKPLYQVSAPRAVMVPYTSPDGYHIPTGNWLAVPQLSLMRDERIWPRALEFEGFRFVDDKNGMSKSRLTHPSYEFPFWGSIRHAWWASPIALTQAFIISALPFHATDLLRKARCSTNAKKLAHAVLMRSLHCHNN